MPTPIRWQVPTKLSAAEQRVADKLKRIGKFYVFLREIRAELFDEAFEAELAAAYQPRGVAPLPPALWLRDITRQLEQASELLSPSMPRIPIFTVARPVGSGCARWGTLQRQ